jgi:glc operon protein GlcG
VKDKAMQTKSVLGTEETTRMVNAGIGEARKNNWAVAIAVVDDGGHLLHFVRLDGAPPSAALIAPEKARAAALGRRETKLYEEMINQGRTSFLSTPLQGMLEGGVPVIVGGQVVGAIGVSGVKSVEDAQIAKAAIAALAG